MYKYIELEDKEVDNWLKKMSNKKGFEPITMTTLGAGATVGFGGGHIIMIIYKIRGEQN